MVLTTVAEVAFEGKISSEYSDDEILAEIDYVESDIYSKYFLPKRASFSVDDDYTKFYIYDKPVYSIESFQVQVDTDVDPSGFIEIGSTDNWSFTSRTNYVTLTEAFISTYDSKLVRIKLIPYIYNRLGTYQAAVNLIDTDDISLGANIDSTRASKLLAKIKDIKAELSPKFIKLNISTYYDKNEYVLYEQSSLR